MEKPYRLEIVRSRRKTIGIQIAGPGHVRVRAPLHCSEREIARVLTEKEHWIETHLEKAARREEAIRQQPRLSREELNRLADAALAVLPLRVSELARQMGVRYHRITIRNQRTRWGSCSAKGNLNFNVMLMLCPQAVVDYVIVHELCHLKEMNHSPRFWAEVEKVLPRYREPRAWLKANGSTILARMPMGPED